MGHTVSHFQVFVAEAIGEESADAAARDVESPAVVAWHRGQTNLQTSWHFGSHFGECRRWTFSKHLQGFLQKKLGLKANWKRLLSDTSAVPVEDGKTFGSVSYSTFFGAISGNLGIWNSTWLSALTRFQMSWAIHRRSLGLRACCFSSKAAAGSGLASRRASDDRCGCPPATARCQLLGKRWHFVVVYHLVYHP